MNLAKALRAALHPQYWPALAHAVVPTIEHAPALASVEPTTVIDVGANKGQFSSFAAARWPNARIIAFEPLPRPAERYRRLLGRRATLHACALGSAPGRLDMHVASRDDSSSLLSLGDRQKSLFRMDEVAVVPVEVHRLDEILAGVVTAPALLKIDVQGYEFEVLQGLGSLAQAIEWIYVEASFVELYRGQRLHHEVASLLAELGYTEQLQCNVAMDRGQKVQADILFHRSPR
jgi:FkbM family methyltransferase